MTKNRCNLAFILFPILALIMGTAAGFGQSTFEPAKDENINWNGDFAPGWPQFEALKKEQKKRRA